MLYNENGEMIVKCYYKGGILHGRYLEYDQGVLVADDRYRKGVKKLKKDKPGIQQRKDAEKLKKSLDKQSDKGSKNDKQINDQKENVPQNTKPGNGDVQPNEGPDDTKEDKEKTKSM